MIVGLMEIMKIHVRSLGDPFKDRKLPAANTLRHLLPQQEKHPQTLSSHKNITKNNKE